MMSVFMIYGDNVEFSSIELIIRALQRCADCFHFIGGDALVVYATIVLVDRILADVDAYDRLHMLTQLARERTCESALIDFECGREPTSNHTNIPAPQAKSSTVV